MRNMREVPSLVVAPHVLHLLVYSLRRHLGWEVDVLTPIHDVDTTLKDKLTQGGNTASCKCHFFIVAIKMTAKRSDHLLKHELTGPQNTS